MSSIVPILYFLRDDGFVSALELPMALCEMETLEEAQK